MDFLNAEGEVIYDKLVCHVREKLKMMDIDSYELAMLANSFALYAESAKYCNENGVKITFTTEKGGTYSQICPEYTVMKTEYQNILKHSGKFGLNPGDRDRIFKSMKEDKKKKGFDLTGGMKAA
jgi:P27 family predicted phage terminase small subunit